jgi:hypothetical protein
MDNLLLRLDVVHTTNYYVSTGFTTITGEELYVLHWREYVQVITVQILAVFKITRDRLKLLNSSIYGFDFAQTK